MKTIQTTTTGIAGARLNHCGDYAGRFIDQAFDIFKENGFEKELKENEWMDIMYFTHIGKVVAVYAEDTLTCADAEMKYIYLDREDCPEAFDGMEEKEFY